MGLGRGIGCGATLLKYILFLFNIIFFICGAAILGISIWALVDDSIRDYLDIAANVNDNNFIDVALYVLIAVGAFTFLVGLLGCCGACQESTCMLCTYAVLVGIVFILQIVAGILAGVFKDEIKNDLENGLASQAHNYVTDNTDDATTRSWFRMQYEFKCCGGKDYKDYVGSKYYNATRELVPKTCCKLNNSDPLNPEPVNWGICHTEANAATTPTDPKQLYTKGCYSGFTGWIDDQSTILLGVAVGLAVFQLLCIIFATCVRSKIQKEDEFA